jgi:uncharacterized protein (DUF1778 family)
MVRDVGVYDNGISCGTIAIFAAFVNTIMSKTKVLNLRIDPELKKKAKKLAEADGRSLSNWVTHLISSTVREAEQTGGDAKGK